MKSNPHLSTALVQMDPKCDACLFTLAFDAQIDVYPCIQITHKVPYLDTSIDQVWSSNARGHKHATLNLHYLCIFSTFCSCANGSQIWCMIVSPRVWCSKSMYTYVSKICTKCHIWIPPYTKFDHQTRGATSMQL